MSGFHNNAFDPQTLVLLEAAFDEAWLTLRSVGNKTVKPDELARSVLHLAMEGIARRSARRTASRDRLARGELIVASLNSLLRPRTERDNAQNQGGEYSDVQYCITCFPTTSCASG